MDRPRIALLCPEARLRRILRLALQADGFEIVEWSPASWPRAATVDAVVADLDGLRWRPPIALAAFRASGVAETTALLLISVYPPEPDRFERAGPLDYLQPPFAPAEFTARLRRLLGLAEPPAPGATGRIIGLDTRAPRIR
jgi:hypothetical protein